LSGSVLKIVAAKVQIVKNGDSDAQVGDIIDSSRKNTSGVKPRLERSENDASFAIATAVPVSYDERGGALFHETIHILMKVPRNKPVQ